MNKWILLLVPTILSLTAEAQSREALEGTHTLRERYQLMKEKAETYSDYKVIKNDILDGVWRIHMDSINNLKSDLKNANATIAQLNAQIQGAADKVKEAESTLQKSEYERTHLSFIGIPIAKTAFVTGTMIVIGALVVALLSILSTFRMLRRANREKELTIHGVMSEFDAFRKKALEKEVKISRELQSERNKLQAIGKV